MKKELEVEFEKILDKQANIHMIQWSLRSFKRTHPRLYKTIINSMAEAVDKFNHNSQIENHD